MKKLTISIIYTVFILFLTAFISGCEDSNKESDSANSFTVMSSGGSVNGYYILNGDDPVEFATESISASGFYYEFSKNLDSPDSLYISATAPTTDTSSITILIWEDDVLEVNSTTKQTDATVEKITADYPYTFNKTTTSASK